MRARYHAPGVTVVALVPSPGPVPPPITVVMPEARASSRIWGQMRCTWQSMAPAVRIFPLPAKHLGGRADDQAGVDAVHDVGVAGLADGHDAAVADPDIGLDDPPVVEDDRAGDDQVGGTVGSRGHALAHRLADDLAAAEDGLVTAGPRAVLGHCDEQVGVGQADPVADSRSVQAGVPVAGDPHGSADPGNGSREPAASPRSPGTRRAPARGTRSTDRSIPASNRTDVPAGMSSR